MSRKRPTSWRGYRTLATAPQEEKLRWAQWLDRLYPGGADGRLGALQPDMVAETHVVGQLAADLRLAKSCLRGLSSEQAEHALTVLARACEHQDRARQLIATALRDDLARLAIPAARVALQAGDDLGDLLADALDDALAPAEVLTDIALKMPYPSKVLALAQLAATTRVRESLPAETEPETIAEWDDRASRLLSELGRETAERQPAQEAASSRPEVSAVSAGRTHPGLGGSATRPGGEFAGLGRPDDALAAEQEAVTTYRELAAADPGRYRADLASSLANLGARFAELDRPDDALAAEQEAVTTYRELAAADPGRYYADLASSLAKLGVLFSHLGRLADAVHATREAVAIYQQLHLRQP